MNGIQNGGLFAPIQQPQMPPQGMPQQGVPPNGFPPNGGNEQRNDPFMMPSTSAQMPPTPQPTEVEAMDAMAQQQQKPKYSVGDPALDKYINMFLQ